MKADRTRYGSGGYAADAGASRAGTPGKVTLTESLPAADGATVQRAAGPATEAPASAPSGSGRPLPDHVRTKMERAFNFDFSSVGVHEGPHVAVIGARAYTQGTNVHFAPGQYQPDSAQGQELLGHELTHVVQQSQGRVQATTQAKGVAINDDSSLEREADQLGARAARGDIGLFSASASAPRPGPVQASVVQRYTEVAVAAQTATSWHAGFDLRVADDGKTATSAVTSLKECYAVPGHIAQANRELHARGSGIELVEQSATLAGPAPEGGGRHTLKKVLPRIAASSGGTGTSQNSWADCGRMSREVMGHAGADQSPHAVVNGSGGHLQETATSSGPATLRGNVLVDLGLGATPADALTAYQAMTPTAREAFDRQHGLNRHAAPSIGEAFSTEAANGFNFHWGGVVMQSGHDRVTLENFYKGGTYDSQDTQWYFQTYGPPSKAGQTWHDQWQDAGNPDSMTMRTSTRSIAGRTNTPGVRLCSSPSRWDDPTHYVLLPNGTALQKLETNNSEWIRVEVTGGPYSGRRGWIMAHFFEGG